MSADIRMLAIGLAAVIDTVLLAAMCEKPNRRHVAVWLSLLAGGAWLWHAASFTHVLLEDTVELGHTGWRVPVRLAMAAGLLLMPSALLHGVLCLWRHGLLRPPLDPRFALVYLPLAALVPIGVTLHRNPEADFLAALAAWEAPYLIWMAAANLLAAGGFVTLRRSFPLPRANAFFGWMAATLTWLTLLVVLEVTWARRTWPAAAEWLDLVVIVSPVLPATLFTYFVMRHRFAPLVVERSLICGGVLLAAMLVHRMAIEAFRDRLSHRMRIDLAVVEGLLVLGLVLCYAPLRRRVLLAARNLFGSSPDEARRQLGVLAVELSSRAGQAPHELFAWFIPRLAAVLKVEYAAAWLIDPDGHVSGRAGDTHRGDDHAARGLETELRQAGVRSCVWTEAPTESAADLLEHAEASLAILSERAGVRAVVLLGRQPLNQPPTEEELAALVLLVEQWAAALDNARLLGERRAAEERAAQAEKLSMLGLLAGSIAHEIKNPLSSIKTLAACLAEDLGPGSPHAGDLGLIQGEIDRLARTTTGLLEFARPARSGAASGSPAEALERTLAVLRHLARERNVDLQARIDGRAGIVALDEPALRDVFFNLLSNSIDAAGTGGRVTIDCGQENGCVVAEIRDTGPGLPAEIRERLFEPFVSAKQSGTGLGLYTVARRLREVGGRIDCESTGTGTTFRVEIPCQAGGSASHEAHPAADV